LGALILAWGFLAGAADSGTSVVLIYNNKVPESKRVAEHYSQRRNVPAAQIFGFDLPTGEGMSRAEFNKLLRDPLRAALRTANLFPSTNRVGEGSAVTAPAGIRYLALCYGVPTKVLSDPGLNEPDTDRLSAEMRRNEASVDSELTCLPMEQYRLAGPMTNPGYGATNPLVQLQPSRGLFLVTRLDGPSAAIAMGLVDKAMEAETNGLWGRAYFDLRGITEGSYKLGDDMIRNAADWTTRAGFEVIIDDKPNTFTPGFPMSQIGFYAGWYDGNVSGPFTQAPVEFMPGAVAYHLHSFSAVTIRATNLNWVGPLLAAGATATMGCVDEPYLSGTPDTGVLFSRLFFGHSFGEAACAAQGVISWQTIAVGDPLYRPFGVHPGTQHTELERRKSPLLQWSHLRAVNLNLATGTPAAEALDHLLNLDATRQSAILTEKSGDLLLLQKQTGDAVDTYTQTLRRGVSPQQRVRILLTLARLAAYRGRSKAAVESYEQFLKEYPRYPDTAQIYQELLPVAEQADNQALAEKCRAEIKRLLPTPKP
jgi:uncharacterized protein (TIGR03790 family)